MTFALVIPPLTVKNRPCALILACALYRKNTVKPSHDQPVVSGEGNWRTNGNFLPCPSWYWNLGHGQQSAWLTLMLLVAM